MKVYQITEGKTKVTKGPLMGFVFDELKDGSVKIIAPNGKISMATNRAAAEKIASDMTKPKVAPVTSNQTTGKAPPVNNKITPNDVDTEFKNKPGPYRPDTPTIDQLTAREREKLKKNGKIVRGGKTYTLINIQNATLDLAKGSPPEKPIKPKGPASKFTGLIGRWTKDFLLNTWLGKTLMKTTGGAFGAVAATGFNLVKLEEALDGYMRACIKHGLTPGDNCNVAGNIDLENGKAPSDLLRAYKNCVQTFSEALIEIVLGFLFGVASIPVVIAVLGALSIASAGVAFVVGLIIGGAFIIGGTQLAYEIARAIGLIDALDGHIAKALSWATMCRIARIADTSQDMVPFGLLGDSTVIENKNFNKKSNSAVIKDVKAIIQSDPKLIAAWNKGKPKVKQAMATAKED